MVPECLRRPTEKEADFRCTIPSQVVGVGDVREWIKWLHDECETADKAAIELARKEFDRERPNADERHDPKWRIRIRLHTPSHSIRKNELEKWNAGVDWVKFGAIDKQKHQVIVDITLGKGIPVHALWERGYWVVRCLVSALNIGTHGFFWFTKAEYTAAFYERIIDLENKAEIRVERNPRLELDWGNHVFESTLSANVFACFGTFVRLMKPEDHIYLDWYFTGLSCLAKTDVHVYMVPDAFRAFYMAWKTAAIKYGEFGADAVFPSELGSWIKRILRREDEDSPKYVEIAEAIENDNPRPDLVTLTEVGCMKILCDCLIAEKCRQALANSESSRRSGQELPDKEPPSSSGIA